MVLLGFAFLGPQGMTPILPRQDAVTTILNEAATKAASD